jgi:NAD(P)-dependent dehydrogenase (short-subunit alcohol dehydrogenase family)
MPLLLPSLVLEEKPLRTAQMWLTPVEVEDMVKCAMDKWGRVDILINNAGILRDKSFSKMTLEDFASVLNVHLIGSFNCTKAVWEIMKDQNYGRIVMTTSGSGLYGNFGQANYGAAKLGTVGLMNTLAIEGKKNNIHVNALSPAAGTRMTKELVPEQIFKLMTPEAVAVGLVTLCTPEAPTNKIMSAGAGGFASSGIYESDVSFFSADSLSPENVQQEHSQIFNSENLHALSSANDQSVRFVELAMKHSKQPPVVNK